MEFKSTEPEVAKVEDKKEMYKPKVLPVVEGGKIYHDAEHEYYPKIDDVVEKVWWDSYGKETNKYVYVSRIGEFRYLFRLTGKKKGDEPFTFSFKTVDYEYATTDLSPEDTKKLSQAISDFLETAYQASNGGAQSIDISPASSSYTHEEIESCMAEILEKTDKYSREVLLNKYKGHEVFDLYEQVFGKDFRGKHYNQTSRMRGRGRYFRILFKNTLKNWEVDQSYMGLASFLLVRKNSSGVDTETNHDL